MRQAVIVTTSRIPVGKAFKALASISPEKLAVPVIKDVIHKSQIDPAEIDEVIIGNISNYEFANIARVAALDAGIPVEVPAITVDRQCGSSLNAIANAAMMIMIGNAEVVLAGGIESASQVPILIAKPAAPYQETIKQLHFRTSTPEIGDPPMIITAENIARLYNLTRVECDEFALSSHQKAAVAWNNGWFNEQVIPFSVPQRKGSAIELKIDECIRFDCTLDGLSRLNPVLQADGIVTAGNSSPRNDGASMVMMMSDERAKALGLEVLAIVKDFAAVGVDPNYMGLGPINSINKLLKQQGIKLENIDLFEINEAFAAQTLGCVRGLGIPLGKLNVEGGAIAIGHPMGASGGILTARLIYAMRRRDSHLGVVSFCCGGGQGFSVLLERK